MRILTVTVVILMIDYAVGMRKQNGLLKSLYRGLNLEDCLQLFIDLVDYLIFLQKLTYIENTIFENHF